MTARTASQSRIPEQELERALSDTERLRPWFADSSRGIDSSSGVGERHLEAFERELRERLKRT